MTSQLLEGAPAEVVSEGTAPLATDAPPAEPTALETENADAERGTETAPAAAATDSPDLLADFEDEALRTSPRLRALLEAETAKAVTSAEARKDESFRQRQEREATEAKARADAEAYQRNLQELDAVERGAIMQDLSALGDRLAQASTVEAARDLLRQETPRLSAMAQAVQRSSQLRNDRAYVDAANESIATLFPGYAVPVALVSQFDAALHRGDYAARIKTLVEITRDATLTTELPKERTKLAAELRQAAEAELTLQKQKAAETQARANAGPTNVSGGSPRAMPNFANRREVAAWHTEQLAQTADPAARRALNAQVRLLMGRIREE